MALCKKSYMAVCTNNMDGSMETNAWWWEEIKIKEQWSHKYSSLQQLKSPVGC